MDQNLHATLTKFRIIASIEVGQKIDTKSNELTIQHVDFVTRLYRTFNSDSRDCTISYLEDLILKFQVPSDNLIKQNLFPQILDSIEALQGFVLGIGTLAKTYKSDKTTVQKLKSIIKDYVLPIYKKLIYHISPELLTEKIKEELSFNGDVIFSYGSKTPESSNSPADSPHSQLQIKASTPEKIPHMLLES